MSTNKLKEQLHDIPIPADISLRSQLGIQQAMLERKEDSLLSSRGWKRAISACAAVLIILFLSVDIVNQNYVWAGIQKALQFVPGIGLVKEENTTSPRYILKKPMSLNVGEGSIKITGILSDEDMTYMTMVGENISRVKQVTLVNEQGNEYILQSSTATWSGKDWTSGFWYKGKLDTEGSVRLIVDNESGIEVPIALSIAESYYSYPEMGETAVMNGVSITAIPTQIGEQARISLVAQHAQDFTISDYGIYGVYLHDESFKLNVADELGQKLKIEIVRGISSPQSEFYFTLSDKDSKYYTLTLPEISVSYQDEVNIKLMSETQEQLDYHFEIAGFPVTITKTEKVSDNILRVYMNVHYNEHDARSLYNLNINRGSMTKLQEETGVVDYIEFEVEPSTKQVNFTLNRPEVIIRGPWIFEISKEYFAGE